jgi:hypothetical protein
MKLIEFQVVDISNLPLWGQKSKEERAKEISKTIVDLTPVARPIHISYLLSTDDDSNDEMTNNSIDSLDSSLNSSAVWFEGMAIKRKDVTWSITLSNGNKFTLKSGEMLSSPNVYVKNGFTELDKTARKRAISKKKCIRASEKKTEET